MTMANSIGMSENEMPLPLAPFTVIFIVPISSAMTMITRHSTWTFQSFRLKFFLKSSISTYLSPKTTFLFHPAPLTEVFLFGENRRETIFNFFAGCSMII